MPPLTAAPRRLRSMRPAVLLLPLVLLAGCKSNMTHTWRLDPQEAEQPFLGVVVNREEWNPYPPPGLYIARVLRDGPADDAGVREGDYLLRFGAQPIRDAADLDAALTGARKNDERYDQAARVNEIQTQGGELLRSLGADDSKLLAIEPLSPTSRVELTILRNKEELLIPVDLRSYRSYRSIADARLDEAAAVHEVEVTIPFLFDYSRKEIPPEIWLAYRGQKVTEPVVTYQDTDVLPLLVVSLFRKEEVPVAGLTRVTLISWPLRFTFDGEGEVEEAEGEDGYEVH